MPDDRKTPSVVSQQHTRADRRWMEHAACAGQYGVMYPVSKFDKRNRDHSIAAEEARAKRICATCPVTAECLDYALRHGEKYGVWGGLTPRARRRLTASFPRPAALPRGGPSPGRRSCRSGAVRSSRARLAPGGSGMTCEHCQPIRDYRPANLVRLTQVPQHREWTTVRWLREAVYRRTLPHYKIGGLIYVDLGGRVDAVNAKLGHPVSKDDPEGEVPREPFHDCPCGCHDTARQMWGVTS